MKKNIMVFAAGDIGSQVVKLFNQKGVNPQAVVLTESNTEGKNGDIEHETETGTRKFYFESQYEEIIAFLEKNSVDIILLAWWPHIIKPPFFELVKEGILNLHPSFLPYGRGKYPYVWCLRENTPFGVTIHWINEDIDGGEIAFQQRIPINLTDSSADLYYRSRKVIIDLLGTHLREISTGRIPRIPMNFNAHAVHYSKDLESSSELSLKSKASVEELLKLLQSRSGFDQGGCWFELDNVRYEIDLVIRKVKEKLVVHDERGCEAVILSQE